MRENSLFSRLVFPHFLAPIGLRGEGETGRKRCGGPGACSFKGLR
jgi:hypothetical protein